MSDDADARRLRVVLTDAEGRPVRAGALAAWLRQVAPARARGAVTVAFVSDAAMRRLNRQFAGKDMATDVLSFPAFAPGETGLHPGATAGKPGRALRDTGLQPGATAGKPGRAPGESGLHPGATAGKPGRAPGESGLHSGATAGKPARGSAEDSLGDIVIATGVARRQARDAGHSYATELRVLALHGLLHLLGHDHETDGGTMARVEARLRRRGGLAAGVIERARTS